MNKSEFIAAVATHAGISRPAAQKAVQAALEAITHALEKGERVVLPGFGTFELRARAARRIRHPRTGEALQVPAALRPTFAAGAHLRGSLIATRTPLVKLPPSPPLHVLYAQLPGNPPVLRRREEEAPPAPVSAEAAV